MGQLQVQLLTQAVNLAMKFISEEITSDSVNEAKNLITKLEARFRHSRMHSRKTEPANSRRSSSSCKISVLMPERA